MRTDRKYLRIITGIGKGCAAIAAAAAPLSAAGCSAGNAPPGVSVTSVRLSGGSVVEKRTRFEHLPMAGYKGAVATSVYVDASATSVGANLLMERVSAIADAARVTAIHGGHLRVTLFSRSISDTQPVIDENVNPGAGTDISKVLKADDAIGDVVKTVAAAMSKPAVTPDGTDVLSTLVDAAQTRGQLQAGQPYRVLLLTDGENSIGIDLTKNLTDDRAKTLAGEAKLPDLTGTTLTISGLGLVGSGPQPLSSYTANLTIFWQLVCNRTTASTCSPPTTHYVA